MTLLEPTTSLPDIFSLHVQLIKGGQGDGGQGHGDYKYV